MIEGRPTPGVGDEPGAIVIAATPGYFPTMRIPLVDGRLLSDHDDADSAPVVLVSRAFAERHWRDASPIGQRLRFTALGTSLIAEIIGVVGDAHETALDLAADGIGRAECSSMQDALDAALQMAQASQ